MTEIPQVQHLLVNSIFPLKHPSSFIRSWRRDQFRQWPWNSYAGKPLNISKSLRKIIKKCCRGDTVLRIYCGFVLMLPPHGWKSRDGQLYILFTWACAEYWIFRHHSGIIANRRGRLNNYERKWCQARSGETMWSWENVVETLKDPWASSIELSPKLYLQWVRFPRYYMQMHDRVLSFILQQLKMWKTLKLTGNIQ